MSIGTCIQFDDAEHIAKKFETLRNSGFDCCQLVSWKPALWTTENAAEIRRHAEENGVTLSAFWCGWEGACTWNFYEGPQTIGLVPPAFRALRVRNLCDGSDFAAALGVSDVVTHMGFIPENPCDPEYEGFCDAVRTVALHCRKNGQHLLFETGQETPVTLLRCFETVDCDNLGVNLDTANLILYGKANPVDALDVFGPYVRNLHAKDGMYPTNGHDLGEETRLGDGRVDFGALFEKLHTLGYDSYVTIEREIDGEQQLADIQHAKTYLEQIIQRVYGGGKVC